MELVLGRRVNDSQEFLRYANAGRRSFPSCIDKILWPQSEAVQVLPNRSTAINITTEDTEQLTDNDETVYSIYEDPGAIPPPHL